ncbi:12315_t:CDS:2 [Ambispora gerdemannii]|uniref:12315_t:CDS:1 n=1 Tax=Ambispora gerdemannii TaxID=144530 RepID=A0A9N8ZVQ3_9GLOM|nr:12315_t:CDS:2 [Ambispora gerdemannii]
MLHSQFNTAYVFPETSQSAITTSESHFESLLVPVPINALGGDHHHTQLLSPAPSSPMSNNNFELRDSPTADELDIPEFFQYSKEKYESAKSGSRRRRKSTRDDCETVSSFDGDEGEDGNRQVHIQSEQKRRAEIKDGFEELRRQLPVGCNGRKMSKAALLQRTVTHLKNTRNRETFLVDEVTRLHHICTYLNAELEKEKKMNAVYRQKETLDKIYGIGL